MSNSLELLTEQAWAVVLANAGVTITPSTADSNDSRAYPLLVIKSERGKELLCPQSGIYEVVTYIELDHKADDDEAVTHAEAWESVLQSVYWTPSIAYQLTNAVTGLTVFGVTCEQAKHEFDTTLRTWKKSGTWRLRCQPLATPGPTNPTVYISFA